MKYILNTSPEEKTPANEVELNSFRFNDGSAFPVSYIEFAQQFGYGITCGEFMIYVPMGDYCDSFSNQNKAIKSTYSDVLKNPDDVWFPLEPDADFETLSRLIPFGKSENGYYLFWDSKRSSPNEMDIYITDFRGLGFVKAAGNLYELIAKMTNSEHFKEVFPRFRQEELPATFKPLQKRT